MHFKCKKYTEKKVKKIYTKNFFEKRNYILNFDAKMQAYVRDENFFYLPILQYRYFMF